jgi:acyl-CoA synthetase (AMP-forming)/AMP-acid ligase II
VRLLEVQGGVGEVALKAPNLMRAYHREAETGLHDSWFHTGIWRASNSHGAL